MNALQAYASARKYTDDTVKGEGAIKGKDGDSAYAIAVKNGFSGTEAEWLASLKGKDGTTAIDDSVVADDSTYSSKKIEEDLEKKVDTEIVTGYVNLDTGADLNTLVTYGTFRTTTKRIDRIDNLPLKVAGMLEVRNTGSIIYQTYKTVNDDMYIRSSEDNGVTWENWKQLSTLDDLKFKLHKSVNGKTAIALPTEWKEIIVHVNRQTMSESFTLIPEMITSTARYISRGYYISATSYTRIGITYSNNGIMLDTFKIRETEYEDDVVTEVFYR